VLGVVLFANAAPEEDSGADLHGDDGGEDRDAVG
jgi:hypothetical protein